MPEPSFLRSLKRWELLVLFSVGCVALWVFFRALPYDWNDRAWIALGLVGPLGFLWHLLTRGKRQRQAGAVLMDLGRDPVHKIPGPAPAAFAWFLTGLLSFAAGFFPSGETVGLSGESLEAFSMGIFFLGLGGSFLLFWYEGRQLKEDGISWYGSLFKWDKIQKYEWKGELLCLSVESPLAFWSPSFRVRTSSDQKEAVEQILDERLQA